MSRQKDITFYESEVASGNLSPFHAKIAKFILDKLYEIDDEEYDRMFGRFIMSEEFSYENSKEYRPALPYEGDADLNEEAQNQGAILTDGAVIVPELNHEWLDITPGEAN